MIKILGIDYGRAKIGLARAEGTLADPWKVIKINGWEDALEKVEQVVKVEQVEQVVVGVSEAEMGLEQERFVKDLENRLAIPVQTQDEALSTQDAQALSITSGQGPKKRRELEDAYAAAIMLQSWLDTRERSD